MMELKEAAAEYGMYSDDMPSKFEFKKDNEINSKEDFYRRNALMIYILTEMAKEDSKVSATDSELLDKFKSQTYKDYLKSKENNGPIAEINEVIEEEAIGDVPFSVIENVPVFPGCESLEKNEERKECMSKEISQFVNENFDVNLAKELNLKGNARVYVQFKIDKTGKIVDVRTRAPHPILQAEEERIINKLPIMKPGEQGGKKVGVLYSLPISFRIGNKN